MNVGYYDPDYWAGYWVNYWPGTAGGGPSGVLYINPYPYIFHGRPRMIRR